MPEIDPFTTIAPFYDLDFEDYYDDVSFYRTLAEYHGDTVLEFGCGTGRVVGTSASGPPGVLISTQVIVAGSALINRPFGGGGAMVGLT